MACSMKSLVKRNTFYARALNMPSCDPLRDSTEGTYSLLWPFDALSSLVCFDGICFTIIWSTYFREHSLTHWDIMCVLSFCSDLST